MKITIDISLKDGPVDATVAFVKRAAKLVRAKARQLRRRVERALAARVPAPVLPPPALQAQQLAA